jgi:hypothetical protein
MSTQLALLEHIASLDPPQGSLEELAHQFCTSAPHRAAPFSRRNWGGPLHSLCSYQGKLKPSIAHFLVAWFTEAGARVLDPMAGAATIPLEARRLGRVAIANDLSPLAASISTAKLESFDPEDVAHEFNRLSIAIEGGPSLEQLTKTTDVTFGLNGPIRDYFHPKTLREILVARKFFKDMESGSVAGEILRSSLLHMLHGNRPYALSRRSHPVTPFAPSGPYQYRPVLEHLAQRLRSIVPELLALQQSSLQSEVYCLDFRRLEVRPVDAVITSPPFARSLRFWSSNWMRLWFSGWDPAHFEVEPPRYLETQQRSSYEPYRDFADTMHRLLRPGGLLIMHLGETRNGSMVDRIRPQIDHAFDVFYVGRENVEDTESHGLMDKGATIAHWYVFATKR